MKTVLTGVKPTGTPHIGNYLGVIKPAIENATENSFYFIADYHALTTVKSAEQLQQYIREIACTWLACGLDANKTIFYRQSDIPEIFELATILTNVTPKGLLDRAHAYKAAVANGRDVNAGLYNYPILMAADILLFNADLVPAGTDQKQHVEISADIAKAFNAIYGKTLKEPAPLIQNETAIVLGLDGRKMSKSYNNIIPLFCSESELLKCIKSITTDSSAPDSPKPQNHLIFELYKQFSGNSLNNNISWAEAKQSLFNVINSKFLSMRNEYNRLMQNYSEVEEILVKGAKRARTVAQATLARVKRAIGA